MDHQQPHCPPKVHLEEHQGSMDGLPPSDALVLQSDLVADEIRVVFERNCKDKLRKLCTQAEEDAIVDALKRNRETCEEIPTEGNSISRKLELFTFEIYFLDYRDIATISVFDIKIKGSEKPIRWVTKAAVSAGVGAMVRELWEIIIRSSYLDVEDCYFSKRGEPLLEWQPIELLAQTPTISAGLMLSIMHSAANTFHATEKEGTHQGHIDMIKEWTESLLPIKVSATRSSDHDGFILKDPASVASSPTSGSLSAFANPRGTDSYLGVPVSKSNAAKTKDRVGTSGHPSVATATARPAAAASTASLAIDIGDDPVKPTDVSSSKPISQIDVQKIRLSLGMTQEAFAEAFDLSLASLRNWEQGTRTPGPVTHYLYLISKHPDLVLTEVANLRKSRSQ